MPCTPAGCAKIPLSDRLQAGRWEMPAAVPLHRLEVVLGLIGLGNIPRKVVPKAQAFGLRVITHDPGSAGCGEAARGGERASTSCWSNPTSSRCMHRSCRRRGLLNAQAFAKMKKGVLIINTRAAADRRAGAGRRSIRPGRRRRPRRAGDRAAAPRIFPCAAATTILSPHTAFYSVDALEELQTKRKTTSPAC